MMKKLTMILAGAFAIHLANAQTGSLTYHLENYPVDIDYPADYEVRTAKSLNIIMEISDEQTSFYIEGKKVGLRFNSDSLKSMMINEYYNHPDIKNIQINEIGSGTMGVHQAEKLVMSFTADDKLYVSTTYLVYFHINERINALLFSFDIGENNVISYSGLQQFMIESLRYRDFTYVPVERTSIKTSLEMPDFWKFSETLADSNEALVIDDDRAKISISSYDAPDSTVLQNTLDSVKDHFKEWDSIYQEGKIKFQNETFLGEKNSKITITYLKDVEGLKRKTYEYRIYLRRMVDGKQKEYLIQWEYPEYYVDFYEPIFEYMFSKLQIKGELIVIEKTKKEEAPPSNEGAPVDSPE